MARIRNKSGEARETLFGLVGDDEVLTVPDDDVAGFTCQSIWEPVDKAATSASYG